MKCFVPLLLMPVFAVSMAVAQVDHTQTIINGKTLTAEQRADFLRIYGRPPLGGTFWYDSTSGLWGVVGREAFGVLHPGHNYGSLAPTASAGTTGVFINGRQVNMAEALYIQALLGSVVPGRWWLDGRSGNFGLEGNLQPVGNLYAAAQARGRGGNYNDGMSTSGAASSACITGTTGTGDNKIDYIVGCE